MEKFCKAILEETMQYCKDRKAFGKQIGSFHNSRFKIAEMQTECTIARNFVDTCVWELTHKKLTAEKAAIALNVQSMPQKVRKGEELNELPLKIFLQKNHLISDTKSDWEVPQFSTGFSTIKQSSHQTILTINLNYKKCYKKSYQLRLTIPSKATK